MYEQNSGSGGAALRFLLPTAMGERGPQASPTYDELQSRWNTSAQLHSSIIPMAGAGEGNEQGMELSAATVWRREADSEVCCVAIGRLITHGRRHHSIRSRPSAPWLRPGTHLACLGERRVV